MLSRRPIRDKLVLGLVLLLVLLATLTASGIYGLYAYRGMLKGLRDRSNEIPLATQLIQGASDMRSTLAQLRGLQAFPAVSQGEPPSDGRLLREPFRMHRNDFVERLRRYRQQLDSNSQSTDPLFRDNGPETATLDQIEKTLARIIECDQDDAWLLDEVKVDELTRWVEDLQRLAAELPSHLHRRLFALAQDVKLQYRTAIVLTWSSCVASLGMLALFFHLFYRWVLQPLGKLIEGSRMVAMGNYHHRIRLNSHDEMSELAQAMNEMTDRFQQTRDDLDRQVRERTQQVVRSEQLASVGFLAAGVAHEINNPLAAIALCGESLEGRLDSLLEDRRPDPSHADEGQVVRKYLRVIQDEAFRCKRITEKLLDFARSGDSERHLCELGGLVETVVEMVRHLGNYQGAEIHFRRSEPVHVQINQQEMKQVVLNLLTNALDSLERGGTIRVAVGCGHGQAELVVEDDGCGMSADVLQQIFEPFFTRRRGGQGTGLGLSITHRIVADHDGHIEAYSAGVGVGSRFTVILPLVDAAKVSGAARHAA
jgi:signal transduction histidine kinase